MKIGAYDCETLKEPPKVGWRNYKEMGMSVGCVVTFDEFGFNVRSRHYYKAEKMADELNTCDLVVGFNNNSFDNNLICTLGGRDQMFLFKTFDLLEDIVARTGVKFITNLESLGKETISMGKTEGVDGALAPKMWQKGERKKVIKYCYDDTYLVRDILLFGIEYGYVLIKPNKCDMFGNMVLKVPVDWNKKVGR